MMMAATQAAALSAARGATAAKHLVTPRPAHLQSTQNEEIAHWRSSGAQV
jgi:hypothetical protein